MKGDKVVKVAKNSQSDIFKTSQICYMIPTLSWLPYFLTLQTLKGQKVLKFVWRMCRMHRLATNGCVVFSTKNCYTYFDWMLRRIVQNKASIIGYNPALFGRRKERMLINSRLAGMNVHLAKPLDAEKMIIALKQCMADNSNVKLHEDF